MTRDELWQRYARGLCVVEALGMTLDISRMRFREDLLARPSQAMERAWDAMEALEAGAVANPDEGRRVGHYWLRAPERAPEPELTDAIRQTRQAITTFVDGVHDGEIRNHDGEAFRHFLLVGIGGSALGPQLIDDAMRTPDDPMRAWFCDNTDPDGIDRTLATLGDDLAQTLVIVISKSGGTKETRNGMLEVAQTFERLGLDFASQACAITSPDSALDKIARDAGWLARFEMWDWVGGRTSITSAVGLLPAALQGVDVDALLGGAAAMDTATRSRKLSSNPAALLALMWHEAAGRGLRDMVILPYKDRLALFSRYLQQLIMESIGKGQDLHGKLVYEGLTVYGNKGSTDQHAYVQQLREGLHNFHVTFIDVLRDRDGRSLEVEPGVTSGDYLQGFLLGTRDALYENDRESMGITLDRLDARSLGGLIALYERAVGYYASLVEINAYHQPGVEAGKKAAGEVIALQQSLLAALAGNPAESLDAEAWAERAGAGEQVERCYRILSHLAANPDRGVTREPGPSPTLARFQFAPRGAR